MSPRPVGIGFECGHKPPNNTKMRFRWPPPSPSSSSSASSSSAPTSRIITTSTTTTTTNKATTKTTKATRKQIHQHTTHSKHWSIPSSQMSTIAVLLLTIVALNNLDSFISPAAASLPGESRLRHSPTG